jgi:hypothetical protein
MCKDRSVSKEWDFVSKGTEMSVGMFLIEYFTPLTLGEQPKGSPSDEDAAEVWAAAREEAITKVKKLKGGATGVETDEKEVERSFWMRRPDGWGINSKMKRIIVLEFKWTSYTSKTYYSDMKSLPRSSTHPILKGVNVLAEERLWEVEVLLLVPGQRSVREK